MTASLRAFVDGIPVSMTLCLTKQGLLFTRLQRQLIDLPYCRHIPEDGVFCGHVWAETPWPRTVAEDARNQAQKIGAYLAALGHKGIFGIDFIIEKGEGRLYPVEINPRFTGAFPMLSMLHIKNHLAPLEAFHVLEFLGEPYQVDLEELNAHYWRPLEGSHLLLFLPPWAERGEMHGFQPGLYELAMDGKTVSFIKGAVDYREIRKKSQFIVIDGPPRVPRAEDLTGASNELTGASDPHQRLCRLLFSESVLEETGFLKPLARQAVDWVYNRIDTPSGDL
jgi:hypothetical protein